NWTYSPLKFWPNDIAEDNAVDKQGADGAATGSKAGGKISFFAYAPYTENVASTGVVTGATDGITAFSKNSDTGNPTVTYKVNSANIVDLLWGTASNNNVGKVESDENQGGTLLTNGNAKVWTNITRPEKGDKIKFNFLHALSKFGGSTENIGGTEIGGVRIVLNPDAGESFGNDKETKVTVRSIKIETTGGDGANAANKFYQDGTFDLATGVWTALATPTTITFPKQDITNGTAAAGYTKVSINSAIADNTEFSKGSAWSSLPDGVTKTPKDVYASGRTPIYAVPVAGCQPKLTVTITYVVRTQDNHLANGFSEAIQTIKRDVTVPVFEQNKAYGLLIKLGLTSVKFEANITNWENGGSDTYNFGSGNTNVTIVDLPADQ
ncbi:MAG: hypothetical protein IJ647_10120, partial [Prevotella sp.]|nr:hypothetical protein [Prevotella sp.]